MREGVNCKVGKIMIEDKPEVILVNFVEVGRDCRAVMTIVCVEILFIVLYR